jgi:hypothetical protein
VLLYTIKYKNDMSLPKFIPVSQVSSVNQYRLKRKIKKKMKANVSYKGLDRPLRVRKFEAFRISRQSAHGGRKVVSPTHRPPLPSGDIPRNHFCLQA